MAPSTTTTTRRTTTITAAAAAPSTTAKKATANKWEKNGKPPLMLPLKNIIKRVESNLKKSPGKIEETEAAAEVVVDDEEGMMMDGGEIDFIEKVVSGKKFLSKI